MEIWDAYLADGTLVGKDLIRGEKINNGVYHLVCDVIVQHTDGDFLLMQRDWKKSNYPGMYEVTAGGSAIKGETPLVCIKRELLEETGISNDGFKEIGHFIDDEVHCIYYVYHTITSCKKDSIKLQIGETIAYKWINKEEFITFLTSEKFIYNKKMEKFYQLIKRS